MKTITRKINWPAYVLAASFLCVMGYQANAMRSISMLTPSVVATIDLERVFNSLDEREKSETDLQAEMMQRAEETRPRQEEIKRLQESIEDYAVGSAKYNEIEDTLMRLTYDLRAEMTFIDQFTEFRTAELFQKSYDSIRKASKRMAQSRGIDIVFVDDTKVAMVNGSVADVTRQISARKMLYVNPAIDVTEDLITQMNNEFKLNVGG